MVSYHFFQVIDHVDIPDNDGIPDHIDDDDGKCLWSIIIFPIDLS